MLPKVSVKRDCQGLPRSELSRGGHFPIDLTADAPDFLTIRGDIGNPKTGKRVIDAALDRFGRVDTLINNAGIFMPGEFDKQW